MESDGELRERSAYARELAERALVALLVELQDQALPLIVLGGLVPEVLTRGQEPEVPKHLGTTDVDIHIDLGIDPTADLGPLEEALRIAGFEPQEKPPAWRWRGRIEGFFVKVEFLCGLEDQPAEVVVRPVGCRELGAANLRGTAFVAQDYEWTDIVGEVEGRKCKVRARFAGLEGYLMSKAYAVWSRGLQKDYYDFVYVLLYNRLGGPSEAAAALGEGKFRKRIRLSLGPWPELRARFTGPVDIGPRSYAAEALRAEPAAEEATLRQDAVGAVELFLRRLEDSLDAESQV